MDFRLHQAEEILNRTPASLDALLRGASPEWHDTREGEGTWSPREVVAHLVYNEEVNWISRANRILTAGESQAFDPFDRFAHLTRYGTGDWSVDALLDRFAELRRANLATLREWNLTEQQLESAGRHPDFGRVTLAQLLATWCVHDMTHFAQILRVVARQYDTAVGPWKQYLSILKWK